MTPLLANLALLAAGALAGVVADRTSTSVHRTVRRAIHAGRLRKRHVTTATHEVYAWLQRYYESAGWGTDLYRCRIGAYELTIPFLTRPDWIFGRPVDAMVDSVVAFTRSDESTFPVHHRRIARRVADGQQIFDEPAIYLDHIEQSGGGPVLHVRACGYLPIASNMIRLEEETFAAIAHRRIGRTPFRDEVAANTSVAASARVKPFPVGCAVALALRTPAGYELAIHVRSAATITFAGARTVTPNYGLCPVLGDRGDPPSALLYYNFVKEYLEELFDYDEINHLVAQRRVDPTWFYKLPEAELLRSCQHFRLEALGLGFNALNGVANIAMLAVIDDVTVSGRLKEQMRANWEIAQGTHGEPSIEFVPVDSPQLAVWLMAKQYNPASAFAISRAVERLRGDPPSRPV